MEPKQGERYRHYKGNFYEVIGMAIHTETGEDMVVYQCEKSKTIFTRPFNIWYSGVNKGYGKRRFTKV